MNIIAETGRANSPALMRLRAETATIHRRVEARLDPVARLADPAQRSLLIGRYAALHIPAETVLAPWLTALLELNFTARCREPLLAAFAEQGAPEFPEPHSMPEALGVLYVLEGSTLGGRMILRELAARRVSDPALAFLDPYGSQTGMMWRVFLAVLAREIGDDETRIAQATRGGVMGFRHAERVLCGEDA